MNEVNQFINLNPDKTRAEVLRYFKLRFTEKEIDFMSSQPAVTLQHGQWICNNGAIHNSGEVCDPKTCLLKEEDKVNMLLARIAKSLKRPILAVIDQEIAMEALNDNIIILEDPYRTGFECKACDGEGHTNEICKTCGGNKLVAQNSDYSAPAATLTDTELKALPPHFVEKLLKKRDEQQEQKISSGGLVPCQKCIAKDRSGNSIITGFEQCPLCKGLGASMIVPDYSMRRPTSGIVKSLGPLCKFLQAGDRVVYSNMVGHCINYAHKTTFRTMREDEIMMRLHGTNTEKFQRKLA